MSQLKIGIVEGWSAPLDFQLLNDGSPQNLTSMTLTGVAYNRVGVAVDLSSDVTVLSATAGTVRLTPDTGDFVKDASPYDLRFKIVDNSTQSAYFPSDESIVLIVRR